MNHLKLFELFNQFDYRKNIKSDFILRISKKMGEIAGYEMDVLQKTLGRLTSTNYSKIIPQMNHEKISKEDIYAYVVAYVNNSTEKAGPKVYKVGHENDDKLNIYKNMPHQFNKLLADKIAVKDRFGMLDLQVVLDKLLRKGVHKSDIPAYINEYLKNKSAPPKYIEYWKDKKKEEPKKEEPKKSLKDLNDDEYLKMIDYESSIG